jgi:hypothetical protein
MKKLLFVALALLAFLGSSCKDQQDENLGTILIRFQNQLNHDITDAYYDFDPNHQTDIGWIPAGGSTGYIEFSYFEVGDGIPMGFLRGKMLGQDFSAWSGLWCGTGVTFYQLAPGKYTMEIVEGNPEFANAYLRFKE